MKSLILDIVRTYRKLCMQAWDHYFESVGRPRSERASVTNSEQRKWVAKPNTKEPTVNTTCMNVITSRLEDEPQTDCGDFADRLAYERGVKHAWEVAQKVFNSTVTFYEAEDVAKQIDKDINVRSKDETQTDVYDYKGNGKWERSE